ncbi:MAG: putative bifunctional diguanylate cyclase/phosphodiesterase [Janthinobacterium lividum]
MPTCDSGEAIACVSLLLKGLGATRASFGYLVGEQAAALCATRLLTEIRGRDKVVGLGGDTFAVLLYGLSDSVAVEKVVERLRERLERSLLVEGQVIDLSVVAGIATGSAGEDPDILFKRSSMALRAAETEECPRLRFFEPDMEYKMLLDQSISRDLRKALPLRQFSLCYQPQIDLRQRKVVGCEALIRWTHPSLGMIPPLEFIPLAEATGLIHSIGDWVMRTACKQIVQLRSDVTVAVNVSPVQFRNSNFVEDVQDALAVSKLPGAYLELELTEGVLLANSDATLQSMRSLRNMGVRLAMDDFGTGYSSLSQLARVPFNTLKIDRSLVGQDPKQRAIIRSAVALAEGLGMEALAEGIETDSDLKSLCADGCALFQGYLFAKPVPFALLDDTIEAINRSLASTENYVERGLIASM